MPAIKIKERLQPRKVWHNKKFCLTIFNQHIWREM